MGLEPVEVLAADDGGLAQVRGLALEAAESRPVAERELQLVGIEHAQRDDLVPLVAEPRQPLAQPGDGREEVGDEDDQRPAAEAVVRAHQRLKAQGYGLLIHDAYRPWYVTKMFWDATPDELKHFVADPAAGSRHNRGCAVDLTLYDLATGEPVEMVAGYDEFSPRSYPAYPGGTSLQRWHRKLLRKTMEAEGFSIYEFEWWHFDYKDWREYAVGNVKFEQIDPR